MADDNNTGPFFEAFSNFGRNLRLPEVTVADVMDHHAKNIAAMQEAAAECHASRAGCHGHSARGASKTRSPTFAAWSTRPAKVA